MFEQIHKTVRNGATAGVTIIEVMIALMLFSTAIVGVCQLTTMVKESSDRSRDHYIAVNIAKNRLEKSATLDFNELSMLAENGTVVNFHGNPDVNGAFRRQTTVTSATNNLVEIVVSVKIAGRKSLSWDGADASEESVRSYYADQLRASL